MNEKQGWIVISLLAALLLCDVAVAFRLQTAAGRVESAAARLEEQIILQAAMVYVHGQALDDATDLPLAGFTAELYYGGRRLGASTSNASGYWGISASVQAGEFELRFYAPDARPRITQVLRAPNVTDFRLSADLLSCTFRVSPAGGQTGNFLVFCAPMVTMATPTFTATLEPVTPSPTWTPGPTPTVPETSTSVPTSSPTPTGTLCFLDPPPALVEKLRQEFSAVFPPPPDSELTHFGFQGGFGWPMLARVLETDGQQFEAQLWTPFYVLIRWPNGCFSIIDGWTFHEGG